MKYLVLFFFLVCCQANAQDTISIYFNFGSSQLPPHQFEELNTLSSHYNLSDLDSVQFIGMADSVGNLKSNLRLSEKRARNVARYCNIFLPPQCPVTIIALGERSKSDPSKNRRVDIVLFLRELPTDTLTLDTVTNSKLYCYNIDYQLLHRSNLREVSKRNEDLILIETYLQDVKRKKQYFYGVKNREGEFVSVRVKWSSKRNRGFNWLGNRYVTSIPKESFESYKIFQVSEPPCDTCAADLAASTPMLKEDTCLQTERFLMHSVQVKTILFNNNWIKIRTPREYVDINDDYFIGCDYSRKLVWTTKKGRHRKKYYYSRLTIGQGYIHNIVRMMACCETNPEPSACDDPILCGGYCVQALNPGLYLNFKTGSYFQQSRYIPYTLLGLNFKRYYCRAGFFGGLDLDRNLIGELEFQTFPYSFVFSTFIPSGGWQTPTNIVDIERIGRVYFGSGLRSKFIRGGGNILEQNVHAGFSIESTNDGFSVDRIFIQSGIAMDYFNSQKKLYSMVEIGLTIQLFGIRF